MKAIRKALSLLDKRNRRILRHRLAARRRRKRFGEKPVVAVTGSVGKTTTVHFLNHVLGAHRNVILHGGGNTIEGAIASMRRLRPHHEVSIVEAASGGPGTLRPVLDIIKPTIGITTTVSTDHYTAFRTLEATAEEKAELARSIPADGLCLLNMDDEYVRAMASQTQGRVVCFGQSMDAEYRAVAITDIGLQGVRFTVLHDGAKTPFSVPVLGSHLAPSLLGAISCMHLLGLPLETIASTASSFRPVAHRCSLHQLAGGQIIVSDVSKAPGGTVKAPFALLDSIAAPRKTIVIGQISDYQGDGIRMYRSACRAACEHADRVIMVTAKGKKMRAGVDTRAETEFHLVDDARALAELIDTDCIPNEVMLLKSSRNFHFERVLLDDVKPVNCWRATCPATHHCERCGNLYDPECRTQEKPPRQKKLRSPRFALPGPPSKS